MSMDHRERVLAEAIAIQRDFIIDAWDDPSTAHQLLLELHEDDFTDPHALDGYRAIKLLMKQVGTIDMFAVRKFLVAKKRTETVEVLTSHMGTTGRSYIRGSHYKALVAPIKKDTLIRKARQALKEGLRQVDLFEAEAEDVTQESLQADIARGLGGAFAHSNTEQGLPEGKALSDLADLMEAQEQARLDNKPIPGRYLQSAWGSLNEVTGGAAPGDLIVIGGRPAMGKSAFGMQLLRDWSLDCPEKDFLLFCKEMDWIEIAKRIVSQDLEISSKEIAPALVRELMKKHRNIIIFDQRCRIRSLKTIAQIIQRHALMPRSVGGAMVDYLQLYCSAADRADVEEGSRLLKETGGELGAPILALSQLSRKCEDRPTKRPEVSDLRESGAIEQDANKVFLVYRPGAYFTNTDPADAEIIIPKQRSGPGSAHLTLPFKMYGLITKFREDPGREIPENPQNAGAPRNGNSGNGKSKFPCREVPMEDHECPEFFPD